MRWVDRGFEPRMKADPKYPTGIDLDISRGAAMTCTATLPYPAKRCGFYLVTCERCGCEAVVTTTGRADDPRSITMGCKGN
jgi:hypothetical protein